MNKKPYSTVQQQINALWHAELKGIKEGFDSGVSPGCAKCGSTGLHACTGIMPGSTPPGWTEIAIKADTTQVGGDHYKNKTIQPWDVMSAWMTKEEFQAYLRGNVIKYIARYKDKNGVEDLKKARHYLDKLIEVT